MHMVLQFVQQLPANTKGSATMQTLVEANWPTLLACDTSQELPSQQQAKSKEEKLLIVAAKIAHIWWHVCQA